MAASADKVQYILETLLQESIPLVKRGIFSQVELREMMHRRQKCENAMLKKTYKITDYLGAIEYEYELERERRARMDQLAKVEDGHSNPAFRKESSSDFVIVKRIIKLWDRTMHKYKFKLHLWKQYLKLCITIGSKKHFYKTLTKALRFLPFETDLWKIGVEYEKQVGHNLWKGRKILIKGMKMVSAGLKNIELGQYMIRFQIYFLNALLQRRQIISKGEEAMKFVGEEEADHADKEEQEGNEAMDNIDLAQYDQMLWLVIQEIFRKNQNEQVQSLKFENIKAGISSLLVQLFKSNKNETIKDILSKTQQRLKSYFSAQSLQIKVQNDLEVEQKLEEEVQQPSEFDNLVVNTNEINAKYLEVSIKKRCLRPAELAELYEYILDLNFNQAVEHILSHRKLYRLPAATIFSLLNRLQEMEDTQDLSELKQYLFSQIDKLQGKDYRANVNLLKSVVRFNSSENKPQLTTKIMRSLTILYKNQPQFLEMCNRISNSY